METETYSDFWLECNDDLIDANPDYLSLIRLSVYKKSISNFVRILCERNIPVKFFSDRISFTDGECVYLSCKIKNKKDFDLAVGLALHEAAHIIHSDFNILLTLWQRIPNHLYELGEKLNMSKHQVISFYKLMINYVEDRYIDAQVFKTAPGYRGYYLTLYSKYFNVQENSQYLKSDILRDAKLNSYEFRILNLTHPDRDLDALPGLREIYDVLDIYNILSATTADMRVNRAELITEIVFENIIKQKFNSNGRSVKNTLESSKDGENSLKIDDEIKSNTDDEFDKSQSKTEVQNELKSDEKSSEGGELEDSSGETTGDKKLDSILKKQKEFTNSDIRKSKLSVKDSVTLNVIEHSDMEIVMVGKNLISHIPTGIECVTVKNFTESILFSDNFPLSDPDINVINEFNENLLRESELVIRDGIRLGNSLGKKLQCIENVSIYKSYRHETGIIERRHLHELASDNECIFYKKNVKTSNVVDLHISVDASGSMTGEKWKKTMILLVAICKAATFSDFINVMVSFRTSINHGFNGKCSPYILIAYDSKKDDFSKIPTLFKYLTPSNTTPEGLAFESIESFFSNSSGENKIFLNISDGEPFFLTDPTKNDGRNFLYSDDLAVEHTKKVVDGIRSKGYSIMSFFIKSYNDDNFPERQNKLLCNFRKMYGKDAKFIDVGNVIQIARSMNAIFLKSLEIR